MQAEAEVCRDMKDALAEAPGGQGVVGDHGWLERGKEEACSLPIIPMEIKKGKSHPLRDEESALEGVCELRAASLLQWAQIWVLMLSLCR